MGAVRLIVRLLQEQDREGDGPEHYPPGDEQVGRNYL